MVNFLTEPGRRVPPSLTGVRKAESEVAFEGVEILGRVEADVDGGNGCLSGGAVPLDKVALERDVRVVLVKFALFDNSGGLNGFFPAGRVKLVLCGETGRGDRGWRRFLLI